MVFVGVAEGDAVGSLVGVVESPGTGVVGFATGVVSPKTGTPGFIRLSMPTPPAIATKAMAVAARPERFFLEVDVTSTV